MDITGSVGHDEGNILPDSDGPTEFPLIIVCDLFLCY